MTEHHGIPPNSNTSSYLSIYSNLLTSLDHPTNSFVAVNNFPTHFLLNVREHHGIASVVSPWCLLGVPWDPLTKERQGRTPRNTRGLRFCSGVDRQSNFFFRRDPNYQSVNEDPGQFDMERQSVHLYHKTTSCGCTLGVNLSEMNAENTMTKNKLLHRDLDARNNHLNIEGTVIPLGGLLVWPFYWISSFGCVWAMKLTNLLSE